MLPHHTPKLEKFPCPMEILWINFEQNFLDMLLLLTLMLQLTPINGVHIGRYPPCFMLLHPNSILPSYHPKILEYVDHPSLSGCSMCTFYPTSSWWRQYPDLCSWDLHTRTSLSFCSFDGITCNHALKTNSTLTKSFLALIPF